MKNPCEDFLTAFKCVCSSAVLLFSIVLVMASIAVQNTRISQYVHPIVAFVVIWVAVFWLSMVEGGQAALVGLPPVDKELYASSHPRTHKCTTLAHKGDNLDRYLIGRQFLVVMIVFVTNLSGAPLMEVDLLGMPSILQQIFLGSGVAMILMTANIGQLTSQVNASHCMLDYINNYFMLFTLYVALFIEASGLLHAVYVVQMTVAYLSGKPVTSKDPVRGDFQNMFFWGRVFVSLAILGYSFAVTLTALFNGQTTMWDGVPKLVAVAIFFVLMSIVGMLEGMQIAFYAVAKRPRAELVDHPNVMKTCDLLFRGEGRNLPGFMIGRQICVTMCFFFIARITTLDVREEQGGETVFGVSWGLQRFFNTGLLGTIITTVVGSISWQLLAASFPMAFLANPLVYILLRFCLLLESTGICSASWVLAWLYAKVFGLKKDEEYIGTPEERAAQEHEDRLEEMDAMPGHLYPGVPTMPRVRPRRVKQLSRRGNLFDTDVDSSDTSEFRHSSEPTATIQQRQMIEKQISSSDLEASPS